MKALMYIGDQQMEIREIKAPEGPFLVKVLGCTVCGTDPDTNAHSAGTYPDADSFGSYSYADASWTSARTAGSSSAVSFAGGACQGQVHL